MWRANACRIVEEDADRIVLWFARGAPAKYPASADGREIRIPCADWTLADRVNRRDALGLFAPGRGWSVWLFFDAKGFHSWYVNLERDVRRTPIGVDSSDEKLDIVIEPDGTWRLKDEDELEQAAALGLVDTAAVRARVEAVLADPPWPTGWEEWRPNPGWKLPELPAGWDLVEES